MIKNRLDEKNLRKLNNWMDQFNDVEYLKAFPFAALLLSYIMVGMSAIGIYDEYSKLYPITETIFWISLIATAILTIAALLFLTRTFSQRFQRMQRIVVCIAAYIIANIFYLFYFLAVDANDVVFLTQLGTCIFIGGNLFCIYYVVRAFKSIASGTFRIKGKRVYNIPRSSLFFIIPTLFFSLATYIVYSINKYEVYKEMDEAIGTLFFLALIFMVQYLVSIVFAEFVMYTYVAFVYPQILSEAVQKRESHKPSEPSQSSSPRVWVTLLVKLVQYACLVFLMIMPLALARVDQIGMVIVCSVIVIVSTYFLLKWMSRYNIRQYGFYMIYGALSLMTVAFVYLLIGAVTNQDFDSLELGWAQYVIWAATIFFWYYVDIINVFRGNGRRKTSDGKSKTVKKRKKK